MGSGPQRMTAITVSTDQFRASDNPDKVYAGIASNSHKFIAEMRLVAEAMMAAGDKFLVGARTVNKDSGAVTQTFYVPEDKADLVVRNINVRRDTYRNKDYLDKHVYNLQNAEIVTGRDDVMLVERRYDFESANARRLGIRDIHAAGGIADKSKYRDLEHPYATAMYLPLDKAEYEARSGRSRSGWVQSQFNRALGHEASSERSFARAMKDRSEDERRRKESVKEAREEAREKQRKERESQREADRQAREDERTERINARAAASVQKAQERTFRQYQKEQEHRLKEQQKEQELRKREEARAESASNRERLSLFVRISAMLATVVALIRGISTSLLGAAGKAAGSVQSRLPNGFDVSTPVLDGIRSALSKLDLTGVFEPLVDAVTETVQKIRVQTLEGLQTGLTAAEVRLYDTNDVAHQLAAGTTVGAMKELTSSARDIIALAQENNLGDDYAKMIMGSGLITELTQYSMGKGGYTTAGVFEDIIDAYFGQFKSGKNVLGQDVAPELLMQELTASIASLMGANAGAVLYNMMLNSLNGSYYSPYNNFEEWMYSTRTMQQIQEGAFAIPKEQLDYADVLSKRMSDTEATLQAVFDKFLLGMQDWLASFLDVVDSVAYWFMSDYDKAVVNESNRNRNREVLERLRPEEAAARARAVQAMGYPNEEALLKRVKVLSMGGEVKVLLDDAYSSDWSTEQVARLMEWLQLYEAVSQAQADMNVTGGRVPYRSSAYTPEGLAYGRRNKTYDYLHEAAERGPANLFERIFLNRQSESRYVDEKIALLFLQNPGIIKADSVDAAIDELFDNVEKIDTAGFNQASNLTDLIDQIMLNEGEKLPDGQIDFSREQISAFYKKWKNSTDSQKRVRALLKAIADVTGETPTGLTYGGTYWQTYIDWLEEAQAKWLHDYTDEVLSYNLNQDVSTPAYDSSGTEAADYSEAALKALMLYASETISDDDKTKYKAYYNANAHTVQYLELPGRQPVQVKPYGYNEQDVVGLRHTSTSGSTVTFALDLSPELSKWLNLTYRGEDDIEGYLDYDTSSMSVTLRGPGQ